MRLLSMLRCLRNQRGMCGESGQDWITEEAFFSLAWWATNATVQGGKDEPLVTCEET